MALSCLTRAHGMSRCSGDAHLFRSQRDFAAIAAIAHGAGAVVHADAVQAAGKLAVDVRALGVDELSLSAHKLGGPPGAGALWVKEGVELGAAPVGGHQERGRRPGTENALGIIGFGAAAAAAAVTLPTPEL